MDLPGARRGMLQYQPARQAVPIGAIVTGYLFLDLRSTF